MTLKKKVLQGRLRDELDVPHSVNEYIKEGVEDSRNNIDSLRAPKPSLYSITGPLLRNSRSFNFTIPRCPTHFKSECFHFFFFLNNLENLPQHLFQPYIFTQFFFSSPLLKSLNIFKPAIRFMAPFHNFFFSF